MKVARKTIDLNAHIENLNCEVIIEDEKPIVKISFDNLAYGVITAIRFNAKGFDSFGDKVMVDGYEEFVLQIQDINVNKHASISDVKVNLPNNSIRRLIIEEKQICFSNGSVVEYEGRHEETIEYEKFESMYLHDQEQIIALKQYRNKEFVCKPKEFDFGWLCGCGFFNTSDSTVCIKCFSGKESAFSSCTEETLTEIVGEYKKTQREKIDHEKKEAEFKKKQKKKMKIKLYISAVFAIILLIFIIDSSIISSRVTYKTETEMKDSLQGVWVYRSESSNNALWAIEIKGDNVIKYHYSDDEGYAQKIKFNHKRGSFSTEFDKYILKSEGKSIVLYEGNYKYESGSLNSLDRNPESANYKDDMYNAELEANAYCRRLNNKQSSISSAWVTGNGTCSGSYYYFDCSVKYTNGNLRIGTITVYKSGSGDFEATGMNFKY